MLQGIEYQHPTKNKFCKIVIGGDYVTTESGTGIVHTAPGHGIDDFNVGQKNQLIKQGDLLILDGILILLKNNIRDFFDLSIFLDVSSSKRLERRISRDKRERGRSIAEVEERFLKMIKPMHKKYVEPSKNFADIILNEDYDFELIKNKIDQKLYGNNQKNKRF